VSVLQLGEPKLDCRLAGVRIVRSMTILPVTLSIHGEGSLVGCAARDGSCSGRGLCGRAGLGGGGSGLGGCGCGCGTACAGGTAGGLLALLVVEKGKIWREVGRNMVKIRVGVGEEDGIEVGLVGCKEVLTYH